VLAQFGRQKTGRPDVKGSVEAFGDRLTERGKEEVVISGAAMRKLLHICYGALKSGRIFDASLHPGTQYA
jgi:hypothetical protein